MVLYIATTAQLSGLEAAVKAAQWSLGASSKTRCVINALKLMQEPIATLIVHVNSNSLTLLIHKLPGIAVLA